MEWLNDFYVTKMSLTLVDPLRTDFNSQENPKTLSCFVCGDSADESNNPFSSESVQQRYVDSICEVVGLSRFEIHDALKRFECSDDLVFCSKCRFNLLMFRDIQVQLQKLSLELSNIKETLSKNLCQERNDEDSPGELRKYLIQEYETRRGVVSVKPESILGDFDIIGNWIDVTDSNDFPIPEDDPVVDISALSAQWGLKPCAVQVNRINEGIESNPLDSEDERRRKRRLRKLLRRHGIELIEHAERKRRKEEKKEMANDKTKKLPTIKCPSCPKYLDSEELLRFHVRKTHENSKLPYNCSCCEIEFDSLRKLRVHETSNGHGLAKNGFECKSCLHLFRTQENYEAHLERQGGECKRELLPQNCTFDRSQIKKHRYICGEENCGKKYRSAHLLKVHIRATHTEGFAFLCEFCSKPFKTKCAMVNHQRVEHLEQLLPNHANAEVLLEKAKKLTCEICQMRFTTIKTKLYHELNHRNKEESTYQCDICGSRYLTPDRLHTHLRVHQKRYSCEVCGMIFASAKKLEVHLYAKHSIGDIGKTKQCPHCDKMFWDNSHVNRHIKLMHSSSSTNSTTTTNEFACDLCSYTCAVRDYLVIHSRTKKHLRRVEDLGLTDSKAGLRFPPDKLSKRAVT